MASLRGDAAVAHHFPFFELPLLVRWKILRQYVPVLAKIHVLGRMPEFENLLEDRSSWLDISDEFAGLIPVLRSLRVGLYVLSGEDVPGHGYYVSRKISEDKITFTLCCMRYRTDRKCTNVHRFGVSAKASYLRDFLERFLQEYRPLERDAIFVYRTDCGSDLVFVNPLAEKLMVNGRIYPIKNNECVVPLFHRFGIPCSTGHYSFKKNNVMEAYTDIWYPRRVRAEKEIIQPVSLESHLLNDDYEYYSDDDLLRDIWKGGPLPINTEPGHFEISLKQNETIPVEVSIANRYITPRYKELFHTLSKSIVVKMLQLRK